jgi:hypothetical protein
LRSSPKDMKKKKEYPKCLEKHPQEHEKEKAASKMS